MMAVVVIVLGATASRFRKRKTETMLLQTPDLVSRAPPFVIEAAGQRYKQTIFLYKYHGGVIHEDADLMVEIKRRVRLMRACYKRFGSELYDMMTARLRPKVHLLKAEVVRPSCTGV